jgi:large subunit ribosomal protein L3
MKRYNFQGGPAAHGSHFHRRPGSIGCRATPARVWKEKKMPGHLGVETSTVQNIQVVEVNTEAGYMLLKGSIPGSKNGFVKIAKAVKKA